jgi:hypothetical protein
MCARKLNARFVGERGIISNLGNQSHEELRSSHTIKGVVVSENVQRLISVDAHHSYL